MFTTKDFIGIPKDYFIILGKSPYTVTLQSKCTKHCWHLISQDYDRFNSVNILHTHKYGTSFHDHGHARSVKDAISKIKDHDKFQQTKRDNKKKYRKY